ncbi:MAG: hypothetical protein GX619_01100 [Bacteroidales bacterium]|nr:hypothetical protein [Bacteroidales bacterium]
MNPLTLFLATSFCPSPGCWYRMQILTLDADGHCLSMVPFEGETANTKVCPGLVFLADNDRLDGYTPARALAWLKADWGWQPKKVLPVTANQVGYPGPLEARRDLLEAGRGSFEGGVWCLEGVDPDTGELLDVAALYRLQP